MNIKANIKSNSFNFIIEYRYIFDWNKAGRHGGFRITQLPAIRRGMADPIYANL